MNVQFDAIADFGCGPAIALFELARRFPGINFYGFDASSAVIKKNTESGRNLSIRNVAFNTIQLPVVPKKTAFSLVLCIATLHYIKDALLTIQNLYSTLKPGGFLIFNYPNLYTKYWYRRNADGDMKRRFAVVLAGENVVSKGIVEAALGRPCHNFWTEVGETGTRGNPCIFVRKP